MGHRRRSEHRRLMRKGRQPWASVKGGAAYGGGLRPPLTGTRGRRMTLVRAAMLGAWRWWLPRGGGRGPGSGPYGLVYRHISPHPWQEVRGGWRILPVGGKKKAARCGLAAQSATVPVTRGTSLVVALYHAASLALLAGRQGGFDVSTASVGRGREHE